MTELVHRVGELLTWLETAGDARVVATAAGTRHRLDEPLRVALAGRVKAGKSTLINALVGAPIAATGVTECTRVVTWYRAGPEPSAIGVGADGRRQRLPYRLGPISADIDLDGAPDDLARIEVELPLPVLETLTIIDTPGTVSMAEHLSARALDHVIEADFVDRPDVVIYLMRHLHEEDLGFLEQFDQVVPADSDPLRAIGVLSRADEIGNGRGDALGVARRLADDLSGRLATLVTSVHPVAGLLAFAAATIETDDLVDLGTIAHLAEDTVDRLLRSARGFTRVDDAVPVPAERRVELIERLGLYGIRVAISTLAVGAVRDLDQLRDQLVAAGGLEPIRHVLLHRFAGRADVLRAARAIGVIEGLLPHLDHDAGSRLAYELDSLRANALELEELARLRELHLAAGSRITPSDLALVVASLGGEGTSANERLGLEPDAPPAVQRRRAVERLGALDAMTTARGPARKAVETARRSIELIAAGATASRSR